VWVVVFTHREKKDFEREVGRYTGISEREWGRNQKKMTE
jgi:hypothetical protein